MKKHSQMARLGFALEGLKFAWKTERSFQTEVVLALLMLIAMVIFHPGLLWWLTVGLVTGLVLSAELINTALESVCDALHPDQHPLIKAAKDCASGAVLVCSTTALAVLIAFVYHLMQGSLTNGH